MPTLRQKRAAAILVEKGGSVSAAMREAGYSEETAKTPAKLTESDGFMQCLEEAGLTDEFIVKVHRKHLAKRDMIASRGLDMLYKLKGKYAPEKKQISGGLNLTSILEDVDGSKHGE